MLFVCCQRRRLMVYNFKISAIRIPLMVAFTAVSELKYTINEPKKTLFTDLMVAKPCENVSKYTIKGIQIRKNSKNDTIKKSPVCFCRRGRFCICFILHRKFLRRPCRKCRGSLKQRTARQYHGLSLARRLKYTHNQFRTPPYALRIHHLIGTSD